jgi:microcompartment protein CcmL/EutN
VSPSPRGAETGFPQPSIALIEVESIARGYVCADQAVKAAEVELLLVDPVSPGKLVLLISGPVAAVEIAHAAAVSAAGPLLLDEMRLPGVHPRVVDCLRTPGGEAGESLGFLECRTVASGLLAADQAAKATPVQLTEIRAARGIGGKTTVMFTGTLADVEASLDAGARGAEGRRGLVNREIIPSAHPDLKLYLTGTWRAEPR